MTHGFSAGLAALLFVANSLSLLPQTRVNADALVLQKFDQKLQGYVELHKSAEDGLPPINTRDNAGAAMERQHLLAARVRELRSNAKQGDLLTPEIAMELRRLIGLGMQGRNNSRIRNSFRSVEPIALRLQVNSPFPDKLPLPSAPPTLLLNLPHLPSVLDYRFVGRSLVLRDTSADIIVDFIPEAIAAR